MNCSEDARKSYYIRKGSGGGGDGRGIMMRQEDDRLMACIFFFFCSHEMALDLLWKLSVYLKEQTVSSRRLGGGWGGLQTKGPSDLAVPEGGCRSPLSGHINICQVPCSVGEGDCLQVSPFAPAGV